MDNDQPIFDQHNNDHYAWRLSVSTNDMLPGQISEALVNLQRQLKIQFGHKITVDYEFKQHTTVRLNDRDPDF